MLCNVLKQIRSKKFSDIKKPALVCALVFCFIAAAVNVYPFGKNKIIGEVFEWQVLRTVHFDIYFPHGMDELAVKTSTIAEEAYVHISNSLNYEMTDVIPVIVYPSHIAFQENNVSPELLGEGTGGFTEVSKKRVVIPFTGEYHDFRHVLTHELVHAFQFNMLLNPRSGNIMSLMSLGTVPLWIYEGMAEYLSIGYDETADMLMRDVLYNDRWASLMNLTRGRVESGYVFYKEGQSFFYFFDQVYGRAKIGELLRDIRETRDFEQAVLIATGKTVEELNSEWIRFFKKKYYPIVKDKSFDEETGEQITFHQQDYSNYNICPAPSPDGKKIAFISNRDIYSSITVVTLDKDKRKKHKEVITTIAGGRATSDFEGLHLLSNNLTWSSDGKYIVCAAQAYGRDVIYLIDAVRGKIVRELRLPFRSVKDPSLSADGTRIVFIGQTNIASDVYMYDLAKNILTRITSDYFAERGPKLSSHNEFVVFSSNYNKENRFDSDNYVLIKKDIATGKTEVLVSAAGSSLQADISPDDQSVLYISNRTGIYNVYQYSFKDSTDTKMTDVLCGIYYPKWFADKKQMAYVAYQNSGYDIFTRDVKASAVAQRTDPETIRLGIEFPPPAFDMTRAVFDEYNPKPTRDWFTVFGGGAYSGGSLFGVAYAQFGMSDYLGNHRLVATGEYFLYDRDHQYFNYDIAYYFLKYRWDYYVGIFRQQNPYGMVSLETVNELLYDVYSDTLSIDNYGVYVGTAYPFTRYLRANFKFTASRYESRYAWYSVYNSVMANLNQVSASLNFDNVLWGPMVPVQGTRGYIEAVKSINITGQDFVYTELNADVRQYFMIARRFVFAFKATGGKVFGPDKKYFNYYLGGFNTLRGYDFADFYGENMFFGSAEFRFIFIEGIKFGFPLFFGIGGIGGVLFADCGSAWTGKYTFYNKTTERFGDFKSDIGFGFRLTIYPIVVLKLDYAWPYDYQKLRKHKIMFSLGIDF